MQAKLTILGMFNTDNSIFDRMMLPEGISSEQVVDEILLECAELELLYPNWDIMELAIYRWSQKSQYKWSKLLATEEFEYNPIWNKDGTITETEEIGRNKVSRVNDSTTETASGTGTTASTDTKNTESSSDEESNTTGSDTQTTDSTGSDELKVSAFDTNTYNNREKRDTTGNTESTSSGTATATRTGSSTVEESGSGNTTTTTSDSRSLTGNREAVDQDGERRSYSRTEQGNIGITTTQQMIKEEREVSDFSIYDVIVQDFKERFCVIVY